MATRRIATVTSPDVQILTSGYYSRWLAAHNPIMFSVTAYDWDIFLVEKVGSKYFIEADPAVDTFATLNNGDVVHLKTTKYDNSYTVLDIVSYHRIEISMPDYYEDESTSPSGKIGTLFSFNRDPESYGRVKIYYYSGATPILFETLAELFNPDGYCEFDISEPLKRFLNQFDSELYNNKLYDDNNLFSKIYIEASAVGDDIYVDITDYQNDVFPVNASMQLRDSYAPNLVQYVASKEYLLETPHLAKFLTDFDYPTYFWGYPFCISLINKDSGTDHIAFPTIKNEKYYDGGVYKGKNDEVITQSLDSLIHIMLEDKFTVNQCDRIDLRLYDTNSDLPITETKTINLVYPCSSTGKYFFIKWVNYLGGLNHWLFEGVNIEGSEHKNGPLKRKNNNVLTTSKGTDTIGSKVIGETIQVRAEFLTDNQCKCLRRLPATVEYYDLELQRWFYAILIESSYTQDYVNKTFTFDATFLLPDTQLQSW